MALDVLKKRRKRLSMTSLIDVIFLLLLFFMLSSTFSKHGEIELTSSTGGGADTDRTVRFLKLNAEQILLDGQTVSLQQVTSVLQSDKPQTVVISLGQETTSQQLIDLMAVLRPVQLLQTRVLG